MDSAQSKTYDLRITAPLGGPVVPLVKITTAGAFSSKARSDEMITSSAPRVGDETNGPISTARNCALLVEQMRLARRQHLSIFSELARTSADLDFWMNYAASLTGTAGVIGTAAAPSASTASIATVYS